MFANMDVDHDGKIGFNEVSTGLHTRVIENRSVEKGPLPRQAGGKQEQRPNGLTRLHVASQMKIPKRRCERNQSYGEEA